MIGTMKTTSAHNVRALKLRNLTLRFREFAEHASDSAIWEARLRTEKQKSYADNFRYDRLHV